MVSAIDFKKYIKIMRRNRSIIFDGAFLLFLFAVLAELTVIGYTPSGQTTAVTIFFKLVRYCSYLLCIVKIALDLPDYPQKKARFWGYVIAGVITGISGLVCRNLTMALYFLLFMAAEDIDSRRMIRMAVILQACTLILCVLLSQTGLILDFVFDPQTRRRHSLGFIWTTTAPILFLFIQAEYIYLKQGTLKLWEALAMAVIAVWLFWMTDTKMALLMSVFISLFFLVLPRWRSQGDVLWRLRKPVCAFPFIIAVFSILLHVCYSASGPFMRAVNSLLSGRLGYGKTAVENYGLTLFGNSHVEWLGYSLDAKEGVYNYVDCSYLQISLEFGILFLLVVLAVYGYLLYASLKKKEYYLCWLVLFVLIFSFSEPRLVHLAFNPLILLCVTETQFVKRKTKEKER